MDRVHFWKCWNQLGSSLFLPLRAAVDSKKGESRNLLHFHTFCPSQPKDCAGDPGPGSGSGERASIHPAQRVKAAVHSVTFLCSPRSLVQAANDCGHEPNCPLSSQLCSTKVPGPFCSRLELRVVDVRCMKPSLLSYVDRQ